MVPVYKQGDPRWGEKQMQPSSLKLAGWGCLQTSLTMLAHQYGYTLTPGEFCDLAIQKGAFLPTGDFDWQKLDDMFPRLTYLGAYDVSTGNASDMQGKADVAVKQVKRLIALGMPVLAWVDAIGNDGRPDHFVLIVDDQFTIHDPAYGEVAPITKRYGATPEQAIKGLRIILGSPGDVLIPNGDPATGAAVGGIAYAWKHPKEADAYLREALKTLTR